jgi:hypothetical protein
MYIGSNAQRHGKPRQDRAVTIKTEWGARLPLRQRERSVQGFNACTRRPKAAFKVIATFRKALGQAELGGDASAA